MCRDNKIIVTKKDVFTDQCGTSILKFIESFRQNLKVSNFMCTNHFNWFTFLFKKKKIIFSHKFY